jgi:hypothetical protein
MGLRRGNRELLYRCAAPALVVGTQGALIPVEKASGCLEIIPDSGHLPN